METKEFILELLIKREGKPTTTKEILDIVNISYPTLTKWLEVLRAEGKILVNDYGNIKFYYYNGTKKRD